MNRIIVSLIIILGVCSYLVYSQKLIHADTIPTLPTTTPSPRIQSSASPNPSTGPTSATSSIQSIVDAHPDIDFGVSYLDLNTGKRTDINGNKSFTAASTIKVLMAVAYLQRVENGQSSLDDMIGAYPADFQLQQMVNQSNNDSYDAFSDVVSDNDLITLAKKIGLISYNNSTNQLSANDMTTLLQQLYQQKVLNKDDTDMVLSYMQNTNDENLIPPGIPNGTTFYHKYGELDDTVNDAAIILLNNRPFILTIYSNGNGTQDYPTRAQIFQDIVNAIVKNPPVS